MTAIRNLTGSRFGRLVAVSMNGRTKKAQVKWLCRCDCGNEKTVAGNSLTSGNTSSCGCIKQEQTIERNKRGADPDKKTRLYRIWNRMIYRCTNPTASDYERYGGLGIQVCQPWKDSFPKFKTWALASGYSDCLSIDRIDVHGDYTPENCRWATDTTQARNKRNNHLISFNGATKTLAEWSEHFGIDSSKIRYRLKNGWDLKRVFTA